MMKKKTATFAPLRADWTQPHREKLLAEQAGLLANCLRLFRITQRPEYAGMAEEIIGY